MERINVCRRCCRASASRGMQRYWQPRSARIDSSFRLLAGSNGSSSEMFVRTSEGPGGALPPSSGGNWAGSTLPSRPFTGQLNKMKICDCNRKWRITTDKLILSSYFTRRLGGFKGKIKFWVYQNFLNKLLLLLLPISYFSLNSIRTSITIPRCNFLTSV